MANPQDSFLSGGNIDFIEGLFARFLEDPSSVDPSWREVFERESGGGKPIYTGENGIPSPLVGKPNGKNGVRNGSNGSNGGNGHVAVQYAPSSAVTSAASVPALAAAPVPNPPSAATALQARVDQTIYAFRLRGHMIAKIDPLGRPRPVPDHVADLGMVNKHHFSTEELETVVDTNDSMPVKQAKLKDLLAHLRATYSDTIGVEFMQILNSEHRRWLGRTMEYTRNETKFSKEELKVIYEKLCLGDGFETFLKRKYTSTKRFSLDGGESLIPMLHAMLEKAADFDVKEMIFGMAHRGRLNVLTNIMGKSADQIFSEFEGQYDAKHYISRGDVKYHMGFSSDYQLAGGKQIHLSLAFNPSHLEVVDPVVEGRAKAKQDRAKDLNGAKVVPLLIHGDAAFAGQGIVPETFNFARLPGYATGGTIHIVINNQVGFTTDPEEGRSSMYATQMAQVLDIPIWHVNGDDAEACVHVMKLATEYRERYASDVVIDLLCFRRYGHNENDEPAFTQPKMYEVVRKKPSVRETFGLELIRRGVFTEAEISGWWEATLQRFEEAHARIKAKPAYKEVSFLGGLWSKYRGGADSETPDVDTGVPVEKLKAQLLKLSEIPPDFTPHPDVKRTVLDARRHQAEGTRALQWAAGEMLAYTSLLEEGWRLRLTGQDTERGTFVHRHAVIHDVKTGAKFHSLNQFGNSCVLNSPLSEMGCLGFEFGYSLDYPDALVLWEAQFGDFANNAQVIIDQFIAAAEAKWSRLSGLGLLLPHGYEGQGPEHSSARLERFLELCGQDNMQIVYPTSPAQIFHLLRRQVLRPLRKPLIVMTPKSMLRRSGVESTFEDLSKGTFQRFIPDPKQLSPMTVDRVLLCSGKIYYDLSDAREAAKTENIAIGRVEQLYPLPRQQIVDFVKQFPNAKEIYWVQEEPKNMGAWRYIYPQLQEIVTENRRGATLGYIGRIESASPATGVFKAHEIEQKLIVDEALKLVK